METLIAKLQEAVQEAQKLIGEYKLKIASLIEREELLGQKHQAHHDRLIELDQREASIEVQENIKEAQKKNDETESRLVKEREEFDAAKLSFKKWKDEQTQLIDGEKAQIKEQWEMIEAAKKNTEKEVYRKMEELLKTRK